jgi:uncharacterized cupredoxin-like copper-binding protein
MRNVLRFLPVGMLVLALTLALAACGGDTKAPDPNTGGGGATTSKSFSSDVVDQKVDVAADASGQLKWDKAEYTATAGDVTFVVKNPSVLEHNFGVEGNGISVHSSNIGGGKTGTFTLKGLPAGEYQIVCTVAGHKEAGMVAKLVVK